MNMMKKLMIALVCMTFTLSAACGSGDDKDRRDTNNTNNSNNTLSDTGNGDQDTDDGDQDVDNGDQDVDNGDQDVDNGDQDVDNGDQDTTEPPDELTIDTFTEQVMALMSKNYCHVIFNCPENIDASMATYLGRAGDEASCIEQFGMSFGDNEQLIASVDAGRVSFDAAKAADCLDLFNQNIESCLPPNNDILEACMRTVLLPTLASGEACTTGEECIDGGCDTEESDTCYGTCVTADPLPGEGEECTFNECAPGLSCDYMDTNTCKAIQTVGVDESCDGIISHCEIGLTCKGGTCTIPVFLEKDAACDNSTTCKPGLACIGVIDDNYELDGTCQPVLQEGDDCLFPAQCKLNLHCTSFSVDEPGKCVALKALGESCDPTFEDGLFCEDNLNCDVSDVEGEFTCQKFDEGSGVCVIPEG